MKGMMRMKLNIGDKVTFVGCTDTQARWGNCDDPRGILTLGSVYTVSGVEVRSWHTKISLEDIDGKFPSVCFEIKEDIECKSTTDKPSKTE